MDLIRRTVGIDIGTHKAAAYVRGRGLVFEEPSIVAFDTYTNKILAAGTEAQEMLGRTPGNVLTVKPVVEGVIADFRAATAMLKRVIKVGVGRSIVKPDCILSVPSHITQVQKRALMQATKNAGANRVYLIEEVLASAFGIGLDIKNPVGHMILDIGAGSTSIGIISRGQVILSSGRRIGGENFNRAIENYLRENYGLYAGEASVETMKTTIGSLVKLEHPKIFEIAGRDIATGLPKSVLFNSNDMERAMRPVAEEITRAVKSILSTTPPELSSDVLRKGVYLTGSSAQLAGFAEMITEGTGLNIHMVDNPGTVTVRGTGRAMQWMGSYEAEEKKDFIKRARTVENAERLRRH